MRDPAPTPRFSTALPLSTTLPRPTFSHRLLAGTAVGLFLGLSIPAAVAQQNPPPAAQGQPKPADAKKDDEAPAAVGGALQLPAVTVEGEAPSSGYQPESLASPKLNQPLRETPQTILVITEEVMRERGATDLQEVLRTIPGISLGAGEGGIPLGNRPFIRGFDARTDMMVDGARDFGGYFRDPFNLEQVEVVKGPSSSYSGRGSTGGSINQVSKTPRAEAFYGGSVTLGTDMTTRFTTDVNQPLDSVGLDNVALRINAMVHENETAGRDEVENSRWGLAPTLAFGLGTPTRFTAGWYHLSQDNIPDYGHPFDPTTGQPIVVNRDNFYGLLARDFDIVDSDTGTLTFDHDFTDDVSLRNQLRYTNTRKDFIVTKPEYTAGASTVTRASRSRDSEDDILINQTDLSVDFVTGPVSHQAVLGLELSRETSKNRGKTIPAAVAANKFFPNPNDPYTGNIVSASLAAESTSYTAALYGVDTLEIGRYWELNGSLRWDNFSTDFTNATSQDFSSTDSTINYRVGLVFKPTTFGSVYAGYGTSVNPSAEGLTLSDATDELKPEETVTYELGTKWDLFEERLSLAAALFRTQKTNARTSAGGGAVTVLDGEQRVDGFELSLTGNVTEAWRVFGGYTFMDSEIQTSNNATEVGKKFANIPDHSLSLWTAYQITREIDVGFGAVYASERFANNQNTRFLPEYWRFDAMAGYRFNEHVDVRLNILNLTNTTYYDSTHVGQHALVAPGFAALLTTNIDF